MVYLRIGLLLFTYRESWLIKVSSYNIDEKCDVVCWVI